MDLIVVGLGRAGGSLARAAVQAGHRLVGVLSRRPSDLAPVLSWEKPMPECDLVVVAVSDSSITEVASRLAPIWPGSTSAVHLSGFVPVQALEPLAGAGAPVGSFHPLQTLPDPERGAGVLAGAWAGITAASPLAELLEDFAHSLEMRPFRLADAAKAPYHAAASAGANYVVEALAVAAELLEAADVPLEALEPLTRQVVDNVFSIGADASLTGPIARGDLATVVGQAAAAAEVAEGLGRQFLLMAEATAIRVGVDLGAVT